jgi:hypothetical protein
MTEHDQKQPSQSTGTGGGGNTARDKAPVPTAQAPFRTKGGEESASSGPAKGAGGAGGSGGVGSGLQPGGMKPTNERFAGAGRLDTPGATSGPGEATSGQDAADRKQP